MSKISKTVMDVIPENKKSNCRCVKCKANFVFKADECKFYEFGTYSDKTIVCPECGCINSVKYIDGFNQNPNWDKRYFVK